MSRKTQIGRADIVDCLRQFGSSGLDDFGAALGYVRREKPAQKRISRRRVEATQEPKPQKPTIKKPVSEKPVSHTALRGRYYRVVERHTLAEHQTIRDVPDWFRDAQALTEIPKAEAHSLPQAPPLMPWPRLWPVLKEALSVVRVGSGIDIPRLVSQLARGQALRQLPRRRQSAWANECQIVIDYAPALRPFWDDFNQLCQRLKSFRGRTGITLIAFPQGNPEAECWLYTAQGWQMLERYRLPAPSTPVLVLSDLGCNDRNDHRCGLWRRLGLQLKHINAQAVALMPTPRRWWDMELSRLFVPIIWDRTPRPPRRLASVRPKATPRQYSETDPSAESVLILLATAIRVEPGLLRAVRCLYSAHHADVGSEAAAWNHPDVQATVAAFYHRPEVIEDYRQKYRRLYAEQPQLCERAAQLIVAHHAHLSPSIGYEESKLYADLVQQERLNAQQFFERVVKTLQQSNHPLRPTLQSWVMRLAPRQHASMWQHDELAAALAMIYLPKLQADEPVALPPGFDLSRVSWVLGQGHEMGEYVVRQRGRKLYIEASDQDVYSDLDVPGSRFARLHATAPFVGIQRLSDEEFDQQSHALSLTHPIPLPKLGRLYLRTDHDLLTIDSIQRPDWAQAIGCDEYGLWVSWKDDQRRAYWMIDAPGLKARQGDLINGLDNPSKGHWQDAEQALLELQNGFEKPPWASSFGTDAHGIYADFEIRGITQRMRWILPGEFTMGSPEAEAEREDDETQHQVILTQSFWLADTACTQSLWEAVMGDNPSRFKGEERPVETVSWEDVQEFIKRLNQLIPEGRFHLPSEAQWEYACRADTQTVFSFGDQITPNLVNYDGSRPYAGGQKGLDRGETVDVKELPCNDWGLYQMHGNVWEWCQDRYGDYEQGTVINPTGPDKGEVRVLRGGGWFVSGRDARSAQRYAISPDFRYVSYGFRLARGQTGIKQVQASSRSRSVSDAGQT